MANKVILTFDEDLNSSLQIGDDIWYTGTSEVGGYETGSTSDNTFNKLGTVVEISDEYQKPEITIEVVDGFNVMLSQFLISRFIMFSKNNQVNSSSLKGYYAELEFVNNSNKRIELFAIASDVNETSK
jgi:hypothetical protein